MIAPPGFPCFRPIPRRHVGTPKRLCTESWKNCAAWDRRCLFSKHSRRWRRGLAARAVARAAASCCSAPRIPPARSTQYATSATATRARDSKTGYMPHAQHARQNRTNNKRGVRTAGAWRTACGGARGRRHEHDVPDVDARKRLEATWPRSQAPDVDARQQPASKRPGRCLLCTCVAHALGQGGLLAADRTTAGRFTVRFLTSNDETNFARRLISGGASVRTWPTTDGRSRPDAGPSLHPIHEPCPCQSEGTANRTAFAFAEASVLGRRELHHETKVAEAVHRPKHHEEEDVAAERQ